MALDLEPTPSCIINTVIGTDKTGGYPWQLEKYVKHMALLRTICMRSAGLSVEMLAEYVRLVPGRRRHGSRKAGSADGGEGGDCRRAEKYQESMDRLDYTISRYNEVNSDRHPDMGCTKGPPAGIPLYHSAVIMKGEILKYNLSHGTTGGICPVIGSGTFAPLSEQDILDILKASL